MTVTADRGRRSCGSGNDKGGEGVGYLLRASHACTWYRRRANHSPRPTRPCDCIQLVVTARSHVAITCIHAMVGVATKQQVLAAWHERRRAGEGDECELSSDVLCMMTYTGVGSVALGQANDYPHTRWGKPNDYPHTRYRYRLARMYYHSIAITP